MTRIYLAGYAEERNYREYVKEHYGTRLDLFDPMTEVDDKILGKAKKDQLNEEEVKAIVESDKREILKSDCVIAFMERYSAGTIMEIHHAWGHGVPVYLIDPNGTFRKDIWIRYHIINTFDDIDSCCQHVLNNYGQ